MSSLTSPVTLPRTQEQRRSETIGRLVQATIDSIEEVGYHRTSLGEICRRSNVSRGGMFRHFDSRLDLIVAAADEVVRRHLQAFDQRAVSVEMNSAEILEFSRDRVRHPTNAVWFEVLVAARTDLDLRERIRPLAKRLYEAIEDRAAALFASISAPPELIRLVAASLFHMLDGEAIVGVTYARTEMDRSRTAIAGWLIDQARDPASGVAQLLSTVEVGQ